MPAASNPPAPPPGKRDESVAIAGQVRVDRQAGPGL